MNPTHSATLYLQDTLSKPIIISDTAAIKQSYKTLTDTTKKQSYSLDSRINTDKVKITNSNVSDSIENRPEFVKISSNNNSLLSTYKENLWRYSSKDDICYIIKKQYVKENKVVFYSEKAENHVEKGLLAKERFQGSNDWAIIPILLGMIMLASIVTIYRKYLGQLFESNFYLFASKKFLKDKTIPFQRMAIMLDSIFIVSFSLVVDLTAKRLEIYVPPTKFQYIIFLGIASFLLALRLFRWIAFKLSALFSDQQKFFSELLDSSTLYTRTLSIFLLPMVFLISYSTGFIASLFIYLSLFAIVIMLILRMVRIFRVFMVGGFSIFYFILYLCALEIAPLLVIWKEVKPR